MDKITDSIVKLSKALENLIATIETISRVMFENKKVYLKDRKFAAEAIKTLSLNQERFYKILKQAGILEEKKETIN